MQKLEPKKTNSTLKWIVTTIVLITIVIGGSFISGTFYPNVWTVEKIEAEFHKKELNQVKLLGLKEPEFEYSDKETFLNATSKCVEYLNYTTDRLSRVPTSIIIAMAGVESAWGTSRFAIEGNALFGVRTWDLKNTAHMKTHPAYSQFRIDREKQIDKGKWDYRVLLKGMTAWSTNPDYHEIILQSIVDNKLP